MIKYFIKVTLTFVFALLLSTARASDPNTFSNEIDKLVNSTIKTFNVPGVAIGVIKNGKVVHVKGYGVTDIKTNKKVNDETIFKIASNSKAFTSAALALLVEQGKLKWSDKVSGILPNFKMNDPWVTKAFNIRDLLTHRSGLGRGAGDLMIWPEPTKFTRSDVIKNLRYLKPVASFRDEYAYDNLLYIVAGEIVAKISGMSWEHYVERNIFAPLNMGRCYAGGIDSNRVSNIATPHTKVNNKVIVMEKNRINNKINLMGPAGGIKCSMSDILHWLSMQLNKGKTDENDRFLKESTINELWKPVTTLPISKTLRNYDKTSFRGYALGWRISNYQNEYRVSHTGTLSGFMSQIVMFPDRKTGIVLLMNRDSSATRNTLSRGIMNIVLNQFKDRSIKLEKDWLAHYKQSSKSKVKKVNSYLSVAKEISIPQNSEKKLGKYIDPWFGEISIDRQGDDVIWQSKKSPRMVGKVFYHGGNKWWVKWNERSFEADAWLNFSKDTNGKIKLKMNSIDPSADFSFDFNDLHFTKIKD